MMSAIVKAISLFLAELIALFSPLSTLTGDKQGAIQRAEENCNASFAVISDTHITSAVRGGVLELGLMDMANAEEKLDAVVFDGDITDHGAIEMWDVFADTMAKYDIAEQTILVEGNHDTWGPVDGDLELTTQTFIDYNKKISGRELTERYYTTEINGYPVIVLASEGDHTYADVSDKQIAWFAAEMAKASLKGLPIFVFMHQPINETHGLPYTWEMDKSDPPEKGGIGDASDAIFDIIKQYDNVFYISGHIHAGFSVGGLFSTAVSVEKYDGYTLVNVPCYMYPDVQRGGNITNGTGYVFEMYDDHVLIRARNFSTGTWCTKYDEVIELI